MKRVWAVLTALAIALSVIGCRSGAEGYSLNASNIDCIVVYTGGVPAAAVKKTVTSEKDIKEIVDIINGIELLHRASEEDAVAGGIGLYFQFDLKNGMEQVVYLGGDGDLISLSGVLYKVEKIDASGLWDKLDYEERKVGVEGLPEL